MPSFQVSNIKYTGNMEDFSSRINQSLDELYIAIRSQEDVKEETTNIVTKYSKWHPLKGKTNLSFRAKSYTFGEVTNSSTLSNSTMFEFASDGLLYYKDRDGVVSLIGGGGGGEANTASNQGTGVSVFYQKVGVDLQFNAIKSENDRLTVSLDGTSHDVELTLNEGNIVHQNISGAGTNTHAQIDTHIASTSNPHTVTLDQATTAGATTSDLITSTKANEAHHFADGSWIGVGANDGTGNIYITNDSSPGLTNDGGLIAILINGAIDIKGHGQSANRSNIGLSDTIGYLQHQTSGGSIHGITANSTSVTLRSGATNTFILSDTKATANVRVAGNDPIDAQDFVTKTYIESGYLPLSGGTITGNIINYVEASATEGFYLYRSGGSENSSFVGVHDGSGNFYGAITLSNNFVGESALTLNPHATSTIPTLSVVNNITVGGTVDGRNIATDGTNQDNHIASTSNPHGTTVSNLTDTTITGVTTNEILVYETDHWENQTLVEAGINNRTKSITVESPTSSENIGMFYVNKAMTISNIYAVVKGTTPSVTINPVQTTDRSAAGTAILSSATAITNTTSGQNITSFNDATVPSGSWVVFKTTAQSGTVDEITMTIVYDID